MARGNPLRASEGVAVEGRFVGLASRELPRYDVEGLKAEIRRQYQKVLDWAANTPDDGDWGMHGSKQGYLDYKRKDYEDDLKRADEKIKFNVLGKEGGSPERIAALEEIRRNSAVKDVIYRGQAAYEVLDAKKAADIVKGRNEELRTYDKIKPTSKWQTGGQGSRGDGLYHMTEDYEYANAYAFNNKAGRDGAGIVEGVIDSKHLLNLRQFTNSIGNWYARQPENDAERAEHDKKWVNDFSKKSGGEAKYAIALANSLADQYKASFGKPLPPKAGLGRSDNTDNWDYDRFLSSHKGEPNAELAAAIYRQLKNTKSLGQTYMVMKMPFFKKFLKDTKFDCVAYMDTSGNRWKRDGDPSYAVVSPTQFKSYFGNKPVNKKSANMFDAD